jgi:hypothetical protein
MRCARFMQTVEDASSPTELMSATLLMGSCSNPKWAYTVAVSNFLLAAGLLRATARDAVMAGSCGWSPTIQMRDRTRKQPETRDLSTPT